MEIRENERRAFENISGFAWWLLACWLGVVAASLVWSLHNHRKELQRIEYGVARSHYEKDVLYRKWNARHGGVYVDVTGSKNAFVPKQVPGIEPVVVTASGRTLRFVDPASMANLIKENGAGGDQIVTRLTSPTPLQAENQSDRWEREGIESFRKGKKEVSGLAEENGREVFRYMRPMVLEEQCLRCHARQGYEAGEIYGGLSVSVPVAPYEQALQGHVMGAFVAHIFLGLVGVVGIMVGSVNVRNRIRERMLAEEQLQKAYETLEVKVAERTRELTKSNAILRKEIADRQQTEEERILLETAIHQSEDSIVITDENANILYVNPSFERITGYSRKEVLGRNQRFLQSGKQDITFYEKMWKTLTAGKVWRGRLCNKTKGGKLVEVDASISPVFDETGKIVHFVGVKRDVSRQIRLERQLQQAQKMEAIGALAGGIAHDFKNLLTVILGYGDMVYEALPAESLERANMEQVLKAGNRAANLVKQILTFSREAESNRRPINTQTIVKEAVDMVRSSLPATIVINEFIDRACSPVCADPTDIHRVVMNLCTNACHAMADKRGTLGVSLRPAVVAPGEEHEYDAIEPGDYLLFEVTDTGIGMDEEALARIFEPYFTTREKGGGTGLGLSVVQGIIKSLGGFIFVDSVPGEGTTFRVYLPVTDAPVVPETGDAEYGSGGERLLVVDDDLILIEIVQSMLDGLGYRVLGANSGEEALDLFREEMDSIDMVLTDLIMPDINGLELAKEMHALQPEIPIILITGFSNVINEKKLQEAGILDFLMKPVVKKELAEIVRKGLAAKG